MPAPPTPLPSPVARPSRPRAWILALLLLFSGNAALQLFLFRNGIDNEILNARHPTAHDAFEYVRGAKGIADGETFADTFAHGWRMPGYSLFLSPFFRISNEPLRMARLAQIVLTALIPILLFFVLARLTASRRRALIGSAAASAWIPLYHYSSALLAESASLFLVALLLFLLARPAAAAGATALLLRAAALGAGIAAMVYLKPNHLLLLAPVAGFLAAAEGRAGFRSAAVVLAVTLALLAPWSAFVSRANGTFIPLTTSSGYNLYLGTGKPPLPQAAETLPYRVAHATGLRGGTEDLPRQDSATMRNGAPSLAAWSAEYGRKAREIWTERPGAVALYGIAKVLHGFGFSFRGARDAVLALFFLAAWIAAIGLWREPQGKRWVLFLGLSTLGVSLQAFAYLPDQRFKTVLFDLPALLVIALGASTLRDRARRTRPDTPAGNTRTKI